MTNNKDKKVLNVPNLRFPEFTDKWEAGKLEEYILLVSGQDLSSEQYTDKEDVYPYITGASSLNSEGIILNRWTHTPTQIVKRGDILLVCKGSGVGQLTVLSNVDKAHIARQIMGIRAKNTESQLFIYHYLSRLMTELKKRSTGIIPGIDRKSILSLHISIPSLQEQQKVAELLSLIEQRIITQNKIIKKLQSLIKGITILLATKGKPNTTIAQCLECHSSTLQENEVSHSGLYKVFGANGLLGYTDMPQMNGDSILIIKDGSGVGTVFYAQGEFSVIGTLNYLTAISNYDLRYLYFVLSVFNFQSYKTGMAIPHIYFKDYGNAKIYCPPLSEQKRIANVLGKLESKLCLEQNILASFNLQKRYLLGQMFI